MPIGAVDLKDLRLQPYLLQRNKGIKYIKIFKRLLNVNILNSYILYGSSNSHTNH